MRNRDKALDWLANQSKNPTQSWKDFVSPHVDKPGECRPLGLGGDSLGQRQG